jgi:hypothetical protein
MIIVTISFLLAFTIAIGRQTAAFGKIERSLWFMSNYETKRNWFASASIILGLIALWLGPITIGMQILFSVTIFLIIGSYLFDFKYIFPEIKKVTRKRGSAIDIHKSTKVIGVVHNNIAVAYPMEVVIPRHIINDFIDNTAIVVSYCAICRSALVFSAQIDHLNLYFQVSAVWRRNMVMIDTQTKSIWQQATGECIYGELKGKKLRLLSGVNTNWSFWVNKYPNSEYALTCTEARQGYVSRKTMRIGLNFITPKVTPPGFTNLAELPTRETVFGISYNGVSRAYVKSDIENMSSFHDYFNDKKIHLHYDASSEYLMASSTDTNEQIIVEKHWWLGWKEFHQETEIWKNPVVD